MSKEKKLYARLVSKADEVEVIDDSNHQTRLKPDIVPESQYMDEIGHIIGRDFYQQADESFERKFPLQDLNSYLASHVTSEDCRLRDLLQNDRNRLWKTSEVVAESNQISTLFLPKSSNQMNKGFHQISETADKKITEDKTGKITGISERVKKNIAKARKTFPENAALTKEGRRVKRLGEQSGIVKRKRNLNASTHFSGRRGLMTLQRDWIACQTFIRLGLEHIT